MQLDPAGENQKLVKRAGSSNWAMLQPIDFEFTSQDTPQHNSLANKLSGILLERLVP